MDRLSSHGEMISQIDLRGVPHSSFDRSKHNYSSGKLGKIIPTRVSEVYPGDRIKGDIQSVVQFEPLAAPIMGSMVMKQESFYVPYHQLWKHAYDFFTGKNGYNDKMPSISPFDLVQAYSRCLTGTDTSSAASVFNFFDYPSDLMEVDLSPWNSFKSMLSDNYDMALSFAQSNKLVDVLQWFLDLLKEFPDNADMKKYETIAAQPTKTAEDINNALDALANGLGYFYYRIFEGFFGVSTALDYLGWPVMDKFQQFFLGSARNDDGSPAYVNFWWWIHSGGEPEYGEVNVYNMFSHIPLNFMPFRAHYVIWYWNYRDELLETDLLDPENDEFLADTISDRQAVVCTLLRPRCWYKDTFTTALNNTGNGNFVVPTESTQSSTSFEYYDNDGLRLNNISNFEDAYNANASYCGITLSSGLSYRIPMNYLNVSVTANQSSKQSGGSDYFLSLDIFDRIKRLRSFVQKKLILGYEADDVIWSSFMVRLSNVRMRIPEILSRGRDEISINTIVNNTNTSEQIAGDKTAIAFGSGRTSNINYFSEEWGLFLSYFTIMPIQSYSGGLKRLYLKQEQFDFMWPEFATMGMDAIYNYELSAPRGHFPNQGLSDENALAVFGYQGRYYDLKSTQDEEHGRLRTDLNYLTFSREFNDQNLPVLNYIFVHCWPALDMFVTDDPLLDVFRMDTYFSTDFERRLPVPSEMV